MEEVPSSRKNEWELIGGSKTLEEDRDGRENYYIPKFIGDLCFLYVGVCKVVMWIGVSNRLVPKTLRDLWD